MNDSVRSPLPTRSAPADRDFRITVILILTVAAARLIALALSPLQLHADEAQYWVWSWRFDWGYFSKPPMIAWLIGLSSGVFGDTPFGVRAPSPLLHAATATFLALAARRLWDSRIALWTALVYTTMPAVFASAFIMSTDAVLLTFWSAGLWALTALRDKPGWTSAIGLGLAAGLGMLSKYAMIYFLLGLALAALLDPASRRALVLRYGLAVGGLFLLILAPHAAWNVANDFATVSHTAANANWGGSLFHPDEMLEFIAGQAIFGPVLFPLFVAAVVVIVRRRLRGEGDPRELLLVLFSAPALLIVTGQAFLSRAHANWAASAYAAASILIVVFLLRGPAWRRVALIVSIVGHLGLGVFAMAAATSPPFAEAAGRSNDFKRLYGWPETAAALAQASSTGEYAAIVFDDRNVLHQMQYHGEEIAAELMMWRRYAGPTNAAETGWPLPENYEAPVLVVSHRPLEVPRLRADFERFEPVGALSIPVGGEIRRDFTLWRAQGHRRIPRDAAYEENARERDRRAREDALQE